MGGRVIAAARKYLALKINCFLMKKVISGEHE
jgi:hypothetical protein